MYSGVWRRSTMFRYPARSAAALLVLIGTAGTSPSPSHSGHGRFSLGDSPPVNLPEPPQAGHGLVDFLVLVVVVVMLAPGDRRVGMSSGSTPWSMRCCRRWA